MVSLHLLLSQCPPLVGLVIVLVIATPSGHLAISPLLTAGVCISISIAPIVITSIVIAATVTIVLITIDTIIISISLIIIVIKSLVPVLALT